MTPTSSIQFIDTALFETSSFILSYNDPDQKWLIRKHIIALLLDIPSLVPSTGEYVHFDGTSMNLVNISGFLHISNSLPDVPIIIWLHENYPLIAPIVFVLPNVECPIHSNHPFIDTSGLVSPLNIWDQTKNSNLLCDFVHDLTKLFRHDHPSMPSSALQKIVLDELVGKICQDIAALEDRNGDEIDKWSTTQGKLRTRADFADGTISRLEDECINMEVELVELSKYNDNLSHWLRYAKNKSFTTQVEGLIHEDAFVPADEESKLMLDCLSTDKALEDAIYALDKALERGVLTFDVYIRQVRILAREQFLQRSMLVKSIGPDFLV